MHAHWRVTNDTIFMTH